MAKYKLKRDLSRGTASSTISGQDGRDVQAPVGHKQLQDIKQQKSIDHLIDEVDSPEKKMRLIGEIILNMSYKSLDSIFILKNLANKILLTVDDLNKG
tara:strand:+ start:121 stop:414 length:294 start_codon:yes stop_codon:yes gene_type:complete